MLTVNMPNYSNQIDLIPSESETVIKRIASSIPRHLSGPDRVSWLSENIKNINSEDRYQIVQVFNNLLKIMVDREASDIELGGYGSEGFVWIRVFSKKQPLKELPKFNHDEAALLILCILNEKQKGILEEVRNLDFSYTLEYAHNVYARKSGEFSEIRFRGDAYFDVDCLAMNMRSIVPTLRTIDELEFHSNALKVLSYNYIKQGLILVTGITGSGKSTTLDAIIDWHNDNSNAHITTIASPLEYVHRSRHCLIRQREVGRDVRSFHEGVVQALRQDLDIMVIGEMRDPATIVAALEVTDTGHKVFSTLHTSSAVESLDRIVAEVHQSEQERVRYRLADVLTAVISQKLVPGLDGKLILAKEVLIVNPNIRAAIKNNNTSEIYMMINQSSTMGMITMEQDLKRLYLERKISLDVALQNANNKELFKQIIGASA
ncbi:MAG: type IV pilus twitching motility protein PilT [Syntrophothermus sp.]